MPLCDDLIFFKSIKNCLPQSVLILFYQTDVSEEQYEYSLSEGNIEITLCGHALFM